MTDRQSLVIATSLLALVFLLGGGARDDIVSLLLLRPLTAILLVWALASGGRTAWRAARSEMLILSALALAILFQLLPLPPALWSALPGREPVVMAYAAADLALPWLPISLTPGATWNALFALMAPAAALVAVLSMPASDHRRTLAVLLILAGFSGLLGLMQGLGAGFYPYRITNYGAGVGLFANRNHQAMLLAIIPPMLAAFCAASPSQSLWHRHPLRIMAAAMLVLVPLSLFTGSRAGLLLGIGGLLAALWILRRPLRTWASARKLSRPIAAGVAAAIVVAAGGIIVWLPRAEAIHRLFAPSTGGELRTDALPYVWQATVDFFPFGSGFGSFPQVYQIYEPAVLLSEAYFNHAHNDWIELVLTGGLPGLLLLLAGLGWLVRSALVVVRRSRPLKQGAAAMAEMGLAVLLLLVLGSLVDYPVRTPILAVIAALAVAFLARSLSSADPEWSQRDVDNSKARFSTRLSSQSVVAG